MGHDLFVSYSTQDKLFVDALVHRLEESGYRCWYAPRDIAAGVSWAAAITGAIREVPVMMLVFSTSSNASEEISRELTLAGSNKCAVIPVRIENVVPRDELAYYLSNRHWLDVYDMERERAIDCVLEGMRRFDGLFPGRSAASGDPPDDGKAVFTGQAYAAEDSRNPRSKHVELAAFLAAVLLILAAWGIYLLTGEGAVNAPDPEAQLLQAGRNALVHSYSEREGPPVVVQTLRLASLPGPDSFDEYLLVMSGVGGPFDGKVLRCEMVIEDEKLRYLAKIGGKRVPVFVLDHLGRGVIQAPDSQKSVQVFLDGRGSDNASADALLAAYRGGRPWHPPRLKVE